VKAGLHSIAEDYILSGLSVLPCKADKTPYDPKKPDGFLAWTPFKIQPMELEEIPAYFNGAPKIAAITGSVSGNLECIDFDNKHIAVDEFKSIWEAYYNNPDVQSLIMRHKILIQSTISGGYHIIYRYDTATCEGSKVLAKDTTGKHAVIETRGEGAYFVISPSSGYQVISGDPVNIPTVQINERDFLIDLARSFDKQQSSPENAQSNPGDYHFTDPVSWYNWHKAAHAKKILKDLGWTQTFKGQDMEYWRRPGKESGNSATWGYRHNLFHVFSSSAEPFQQNCSYTPFQILVLTHHKSNYTTAYDWVRGKFLQESDTPYIRVGTDYFKRIVKTDRFDIQRTELKKWSRQSILDDHATNDRNKKYLNLIPQYDDFAIQPDNINYSPIVNNCYNLYSEFMHKPEPGSWERTDLLMHHIFGDQYGLGMRYMQMLYLHPKRIAPILVLVSKERETGKTTFLNWLNMIFGANMVTIGAQDLTNDFNHIYATSNIVAIEETLIEKSLTVEKLKALATNKFLTVNQKFVSQYKIPFHGKFILTSNNEDKFARVDLEEIRFFVRKLLKPPVKNHRFEEKLTCEIPAFLHHLTTLPPIDFCVSRTGFTVEEMDNGPLRAVKEESRSSLYHELKILFTDYFNEHENSGLPSVLAAPVDIKRKWFSTDNRIGAHYIGNVLKNEFSLNSEPNQRYIPFESIAGQTKTGTPYKFTRSMFLLSEPAPGEDSISVPF
jgi:hypothetical protein